MMTTEDHDTLAVRLAEILKRSNEGKSLDIDQLAEQFGLYQLTIQRDLHEPLAFLPIKKLTVVIRKKSWMPHNRIISQDKLQHRLQENLRTYLISDQNL